MDVDIGVHGLGLDVTGFDDPRQQSPKGQRFEDDSEPLTVDIDPLTLTTVQAQAPMPATSPQNPLPVSSGHTDAAHTSLANKIDNATNQWLEPLEFQKMRVIDPAPIEAGCDNNIWFAARLSQIFGLNLLPEDWKPTKSPWILFITVHNQVCRADWAISSIVTSHSDISFLAMYSKDMGGSSNCTGARRTSRGFNVCVHVHTPSPFLAPRRTISSKLLSNRTLCVDPSSLATRSSLNLVLRHHVHSLCPLLVSKETLQCSKVARLTIVWISVPSFILRDIGGINDGPSEHSVEHIRTIN